MRNQTITGGLILGAALLVCAALPANSQADSTPVATTLTVRVEPDATLRTTPLAQETEAGETVRWFRLEFAIRMNRGASAALSLSPLADESYRVEPCRGSASGITIDGSNGTVLTVHQNGRYCVKLGVRTPETSAATAETVRVELQSSDGVLRLADVLF